MAKRKALINVSYEMLHKCLNLKDSVKIESIINTKYQQESETLVLKVSSPDLAEVNEGNTLFYVCLEELQV